MSGYRPTKNEVADRVELVVVIWRGHLETYRRAGIVPNDVHGALARAMDRKLEELYREPREE